jgi:hypothetical protein
LMPSCACAAKDKVKSVAKTNNNFFISVLFKVDRQD